MTLAALAFSPAVAAQTVLAESLFDTRVSLGPPTPPGPIDVEGWSRATFYTAVDLGPTSFRFDTVTPLDGSIMVAFPNADGAPGDSWLAPTKFLGDQRAALGGELKFDLGSVDATVGNDGVRLSSGALELYFPLPAPNTASTSDFRRYVVPLDPDAGWQTAGATRFLRTPTTLAEMTLVLGNLQSLGIRADYYSPGETGSAYLDNVRLISAVPEPATALLWACGLAVAGLKLRRGGPASQRGAAA